MNRYHAGYEGSIMLVYKASMLITKFSSWWLKAGCWMVTRRRMYKQFKHSCTAESSNNLSSLLHARYIRLLDLVMGTYCAFWLFHNPRVEIITQNNGVQQFNPFFIQFSPFSPSLFDFFLYPHFSFFIQQPSPSPPTIIFCIIHTPGFSTNILRWMGLFWFWDGPY